MFRAWINSILLASLLSACASPGVRHAPVTPPPAVAQPRPNLSGPWQIVTPSGSEKVSIGTHAVVVISDDTVVRTDTLQASLDASFTWTSGAARKVDGQLIDYRVGVGPAVPMTPAGLQLPRQYSASARGGAMQFSLPPETSACTDPALSALQGMQDAWVAVPPTVTIGTTWTDTAYTISCRDGVLLRGATVRRFAVRRSEVDSVRGVIVIVERSARGTLHAAGDQFGEKVTLAGESNGTMQYALDPGTGRFVRATGKSMLSFTLKSSRRNQTVRQTSEIAVVW